MPQLTAGDVPITLAGETRILRPSQTALALISRAYKGLGKVREALVDQDFDAAVTVIRSGLNLSVAEEEDISRKVYETGLASDLLIPLIRFVAVLANGGKPLPDEPPMSGGTEKARVQSKVLKKTRPSVSPKPDATRRKPRRHGEVASLVNGA